MRVRLASTLIDLRKPELEPQSKARGIANGVVLGALMWFAIAALIFAVLKRIAE